MRISATRPATQATAIDRRRAVVSLAALFAGLAWAERPAQAQLLAPHAVTGLWRGQESGPLGVMDVEVIFFPNGTYSRTHRLRDLMTRDVGTYAIVQNWIHFELQNYQPKVYRGQTLTRPMSDTWVVGQFDGRSLRATVGGISAVAVRRVR